MFKLKELRSEIGITRAELSRALKINQGTLANYENEIRQADYETLKTIAGYFDVSVDYLLGQTDDFGVKNTIPKGADNLEFMEKSLLNKYRRLSNKSRELLFSLIDHIYELERNK